MITESSVAGFMAAKSFAVVGVSNNKYKFGSTLLKELLKRNYSVYPVNAKGGEYEGIKGYTCLKEIPAKPEAVVVSVKPEKALQVLEEAVELGITHIWLQQGSESPAAIEYAAKKKLNLIHGFCLIMFLNDIGFPHNLHRGIAKLFGKMPK